MKLKLYINGHPKDTVISEGVSVEHGKERLKRKWAHMIANCRHWAIYEIKQSRMNKPDFENNESKAA